MIAIGIGCRKACPADDIVGLVDATLRTSPRRTPILGLFSIEDKSGEVGLIAAAHQLNLPITFLDRAALGAASDRTRTSSQRVATLFGLPSVAETAALAGAGPGAVLLVARQVSERATCAIAGQPA